MKLRNKRTGEIGTLKPYNNDKRVCVWIDDVSEPDYIYNSLAELNEEWEDYKEPKGTALHWTILTLENFIENEPDDKWVDLEDCKQMLEKLKAWERLKDKGLEATEWSHGLYLDKIIVGRFRYEFPIDNKEYIEKDLDLLFGGKE